MRRVLSLCTGYAGLDLAVEAVTGARTVAVSDLDKGASKILAHRLPDVPNLGDLKLIDWSQWVGVEYMTAGYPCQPFSHAGKREGTDDPRHIFPFIAEGIRVVGPRVVVLENVRGHLALGFDTVLGTLADIGYDARWVCLRASDVGAPHRRERLFIVATPNAGADRAGFPTARSAPSDAERGGRDGRSSDAIRGTLSRTAAAGCGEVSGPAADTDNLGHERAGSSRGRWEGSANLGDAAADATSDGRHEGGAEPARLVRRPDAAERGASPATDAQSYPRWISNRDGATFAHTPSAARRAAQPEHLGAPLGPASELGERAGTDWGQYSPAIHRWSAVLGRPAPAPTEPGAKGQPRLSPRFVEFMMGLPEGWVTDVPDLTRNEQLKALGNGVVPQQAAAAVTFLLNAQEKAA